MTDQKRRGKSAGARHAPRQAADAKPTFTAGDAVSWDSSQGTVYGHVERRLTSPTDIKSHHVAASPDNPEYLVKSDKTGAEAAHRPEQLRREDGAR